MGAPQAAYDLSPPVASVPGTWGATTRAVCSLECSMKLTKLDTLAIVGILLTGQNHYYTGSGAALCGMALILIVWSALTD